MKIPANYLANMNNLEPEVYIAWQKTQNTLVNIKGEESLGPDPSNFTASNKAAVIKSVSS